jgi:hypothetical protein
VLTQLQPSYEGGAQQPQQQLWLVISAQGMSGSTVGGPTFRKMRAHPSIAAGPLCISSTAGHLCESMSGYTFTMCQSMACVHSQTVKTSNLPLTAHCVSTPSSRPCKAQVHGRL